MNSLDNDAVVGASDSLESESSVFVSYSGIDVALANALTIELRRRAVKVFNYREQPWVDYDRVDYDWSDSISAAIGSADVIVVVLTSAYMQSHNCLTEVDMVLALGHREKRLVIWNPESVTVPTELASSGVYSDLEDVLVEVIPQLL